MQRILWNCNDPVQLLNDFEINVKNVKNIYFVDDVGLTTSKRSILFEMSVL